MKKFFVGSVTSLIAGITLFGGVFAALGDYSPERTVRATGSTAVGFDYNVFNSFTGSSKLANNIRYQSDITSFGDERDFLVTKLRAAPVGTSYQHIFAGVSAGQRFYLQGFVHNGARETTNNAFTTTNTQVKLDWTNPQEVQATISADNAASVKDRVSFRFESPNLRFRRVGIVDSVDNNNVVKVLTTTDGDDTTTTSLGNVVGSYKGSRQVYWVLETFSDPNFCNNGATNSPNCDQCSTGHVLIIGQCVSSPDADLNILKWSANTKDQDGVTIGDNVVNDTQTITSGGGAVFNILVTNTGSEALQNVRVGDLQTASCDRTGVEVTALVRAVGNNDTVFDPGESFTYTCTQASVLSSYTNTATVSGTGAISGTNVTDSDATEVVVLDIVSIDKDDATPGTVDTDGDDIQRVSSSGTAIFTITVTNPGHEDLTNLIITDPLAPACDRTVAQTDALVLAVGNNDTVFNPGESFSYLCTHPSVTSGFTNVINITATRPDGSTAADSDTSLVTLQNSNGGGSGAIGTAAGTCGVHSVTGALQCVQRQPVEDPSDPLWTAFYQCRIGNTVPKNTTANTVRDNCLLDWIDAQGLSVCGANISGSIDSFAKPTTAEIATQCNPVLPFALSCVPTGVACPHCFDVEAFITKRTKSQNGTLRKTATVAKGENATYQIDIQNLNYNKANYRITAAWVRVYDMTIPSRSGNIWGRAGILDGDGSATWKWCADASVGCSDTGDFFEKGLTSSEIGRINSGDLDLQVHYDMNTNLVAAADVGQVVNVAYASIIYQYEYTNPKTGNISTGSSTAGIGTNACNPGTLDSFLAKYFSGVASLGDTAVVQITRPFVQANAGNVGIQQSVTNSKVTGKPVTTAQVISDSAEFGSGITANDDTFARLGQLQNSDNQEFYDNLGQNTSAKTAFGVNFDGHNYDSRIYFHQGDLTISSLRRIDHSATIIVENGDLIIDQDFTIPPDYFMAFIVADGNLLIDKDVRTLHGTYLVDQGEVESQDDKVSTKQLQVSGNLIGNLAHLLTYRRYVGDGSQGLDPNGFPIAQPSLMINFDLRLLSSTPPGLEAFLGENWREEIR